MTNHIDVEYYKNKYNLTEVPVFASLVFTDKYIKESEKIKFINKFLYKYLEDKEFRKNVQNYMLYFHNKKLYGVLASIDEVEPNKLGHELLGIQISDSPTIGYLLPIAQANIFVGQLANPKLPHISCICTNINFDLNIKEERLFDTGSSFSTIPFINDWDYINGMYLKPEEQDIFSRKINYDCTKLNQNILTITKVIYISGTGNMEMNEVIWKEPIFLSIDDLPPIRLKKMIVPVNKVRDLNILGIDMIFRHTVIISSNNYNVDIKFLPSEQIGNISLQEDINNISSKAISYFFGK